MPLAIVGGLHSIPFPPVASLASSRGVVAYRPLAIAEKHFSERPRRRANRELDGKRKYEGKIKGAYRPVAKCAPTKGKG